MHRPPGGALIFGHTAESPFAANRFHGGVVLFVLLVLRFHAAPGPRPGSRRRRPRISARRKIARNGCSSSQRGSESQRSTRRLQRHADEAWEAAGLRRIIPHELRHSYAALMIASGVNAKALQVFMGHANVSVTLDTYGHLMPGSEAEAAGLVETYLSAQHERAEEAARGAREVHDERLTGAPTGAPEAAGR